MFGYVFLRLIIVG